MEEHAGVASTPMSDMDTLLGMTEPMSVEQVARALNIRSSNVYRAIKRGSMKATTLRGAVLWGERGFKVIERAEVERYRREHLGRHNGGRKNGNESGAIDANESGGSVPEGERGK